MKSEEHKTTIESSESTEPEQKDVNTITAVDYINEQDDLEKEARQLMPYNPDECTYDKGELRQPVFACLTCSRDNNNSAIGVCYSCSIQCHSSHELVELFTKRGFVCDCGTTRMAKTLNGACKVRMKMNSNGNTSEFRPRTGSSSMSNHHRHFGSQSNLDLPAEDIPSSNSYNQNYKGLFCSCEKPYNPLEETGNMLQCYFGFECGEDWYHESCILGYQQNSIEKPVKDEGENVLDKLSEPGVEASADDSILSNNDSDNPDEAKSPDYFPNLDDFDVFICWKCVSKFPKVFSELKNYNDIVLITLPHFGNTKSEEEWSGLYKKYLSDTKEDQPNPKKIKLEESRSKDIPESFFLKHSFREKLKELRESTSNSVLKSFLANYEFLYMADPVYEPPQEEESSTSGSLLDLGTEALLSLPKEKAVEGLQAYDKIRSKLRDFFKPFAEQGKVVTEQEVRDFFGNVKNKKEEE